MSYGQMLGAFQIRDCPRYLENAVVGARGQALLLHGPLQEVLGLGAQLTMGANLARGHLRVGVYLLAGFPEALALALAGSHHPAANLS